MQRRAAGKHTVAHGGQTGRERNLFELLVSQKQLGADARQSIRKRDLLQDGHIAQHTLAEVARPGRETDIRQICAAERTRAVFDRSLGQRDVLKIRAAGERLPGDGRERLRQRDVCEVRAVAEHTVAHAGDALRQHGSVQIDALTENVFAERADCRRHGNARQTRLGKGSVPDIRHARRNGNIRQPAGEKGLLADDCHVVRNGYGFDAAGRKHALIQLGQALRQQDALKLPIASEQIGTQMGRPLRDRHGRKHGAAHKRPVANRFDAGRKCDRRQRRTI